MTRRAQQRRQVPARGLPGAQARPRRRRRRSSVGLAGEHARIEARLIVVPHVPASEDRLEAAVAHRLAQEHR